MCRFSARSWAAVRVTEKLRFCAWRVVLSVYIGRASHSAKSTQASHSAQFGSSHASGAADTAENGPERAFLKENAKNRKGKCDDLSRRLKRKAFVLMPALMMF